jgi:hypothetical protein
MALSDRTEVKAVLSVAERNGAFFLKGRFAGEGHSGLEAGLTAIRWLETATDAIRSYHGCDRATGSRGSSFENGARVISWDGFSLELHCVENLRHVSSVLCCCQRILTL